MMNDAALRDLYERRRQALQRRPVFARASAEARAGLVAGGDTCEVEEAGRVLRVELPAGDGGSGAGLDPMALMRASLAASLALGYRVWAARLGVALVGVSIDVVYESDARGELGIADDVATGWQRVIFDVCVMSGAPETDVRRVVELSNRFNPTLANLALAVERVWRVTVVRR
jgi:uncharacterized OsmC-like protein